MLSHENLQGFCVHERMVYSGSPSSRSLKGRCGGWRNEREGGLGKQTGRSLDTFCVPKCGKDVFNIHVLGFTCVKEDFL